MHKVSTKIFLILVKYIPIFVALVIVIHAILQLLNIDDVLIDHLIRPDFISAIFATAASYTFEFCWVHRLFIGYDFLMSFEMTWHEKFGLHNTLFVHRLGAVLIGLSVFIILIYYRKYFVSCGKVQINNNIL